MSQYDKSLSRRLAFFGPSPGGPALPLAPAPENRRQLSMRPRPRPLLVLGFVLIMAALMYVQAPPNPHVSRALKDSSQRLKAYYRENPVPEGWKISEISVRDGKVWVDMVLPGPEAAALAGAAPERGGQTLGVHCPPRTDIVWRILSETQGIEIRGLGPGGKAFLAVDCRTLIR